MDCSPPGSSVHGILQARVLEWAAMPFSRGVFLTQGSKLHFLCLLHWQVDSLPLTTWVSPCTAAVTPKSSSPAPSLLISTGTRHSLQASLTQPTLPTTHSFQKSERPRVLIHAEVLRAKVGSERSWNRPLGKSQARWPWKARNDLNN